MNFGFTARYSGIWSIRVPATWAAGPGSEAAQSPALPLAGDNATRMTDIHDIKPPLSPGADLRWLYWALAIAAVLLLAALAWRLWQKHKKRPGAEMAPAPIPAATEAYQMLDALAAEGNLSSKQFYFRLSAILPRHMERRYEIPAAEMTTEELLPQVDRLPLGLELAQPLKAFCRGADPIKFAGAPAEQNRMARDLSFIRDFVSKTTEMLTATREDEPHEQRPGAAQLPAPGQLPQDSANE